MLFVFMCLTGAGPLTYDLTQATSRISSGEDTRYNVFIENGSDARRPSRATTV